MESGGMPSKPKRAGLFSSVNWNRVGLLFCPVAVAIAIRVLGAAWLFKKYGASYQLDRKTKKLLQADAHFIRLEGL
jgi:hypothetical protein